SVLIDLFRFLWYLRSGNGANFASGHDLWFYGHGVGSALPVAGASVMALQHVEEKAEPLREMLSLGHQCKYTIWRCSKFIQYGDESALVDVFLHFPQGAPSQTHARQGPLMQHGTIAARQVPFDAYRPYLPVLTQQPALGLVTLLTER